MPSTFTMAQAPGASNSADGTFNATSVPNKALHKNMTQSELYTNAGYLALNIWDRFDVFCTLGTTNAYIKGSSNAFNLIGLIGKNAAIDADDLPNANVGNAFIELYTDAEFSWSVGARGVLWECGCATLGAEFQYAQAKPEISQINVVSNVAQFSIAHPKGFVGEDAKLPLHKSGSVPMFSADMTKAKSVSANHSEWQVGLALAYRLNFISPYVGIKWSRAKIDFDGAYIAQPQLATERLDMLTWNPTLAGEGAAVSTDNFFSDVLTKVSVTLNKLKVKGLDPLYNRGSYTSIRLFCKKSLTSKPTLSLYARASSATTSSIDSLKPMYPIPSKA